MTAISFDPEGLKRAADAGSDLHNVTLDEAQRHLIQDLGALVGPALGIDSIPCRGMWLQAVRAWQLRHQQHATSISQASPEQRLEAALEIKDGFLALAASMLLDERQRGAVAPIVDRAYELYMSKYNRR